MAGKGTEKLLDAFRAHVADALYAELAIECDVLPAGNVDDHPSERLIHRRVTSAETVDAVSLADRLTDRLAQADADFLDGAMLVEIASIDRDSEIEPAVIRKLCEHFIEVGNPGLYGRLPLAIEVEND